MRTIIVLLMVLVPSAALADSDCRVMEYPDHFEAVCNGAIDQTPASYRDNRQQVIAGQESDLASARTPDVDSTDLPPEMIVRNDLARLHAATPTWLTRRP